MNNRTRKALRQTYDCVSVFIFNVVNYLDVARVTIFLIKYNFQLQQEAVHFLSRAFLQTGWNSMNKHVSGHQRSRPPTHIYHAEVKLEVNICATENHYICRVLTKINSVLLENLDNLLRGINKQTNKQKGTYIYI